MLLGWWSSHRDLSLKKDLTSRLAIVDRSIGQSERFENTESREFTVEFRIVPIGFVTAFPFSSFLCFLLFASCFSVSVSSYYVLFRFNFRTEIIAPGDTRMVSKNEIFSWIACAIMTADGRYPRSTYQIRTLSLSRYAVRCKCTKDNVD